MFGAVRSFRRREHEVQFPSLSCEFPPVFERLGDLIVAAAKSTLQWVLASFVTLRFAVPLAANGKPISEGGGSSSHGDGGGGGFGLGGIGGGLGGGGDAAVITFVTV